MNLVEQYKATIGDIFKNDIIADEIMYRYCDNCLRKEYCHEVDIIECDFIIREENKRNACA